MTVLHTWSPEDRLLGAVAPLALGVAAGTALVVDLDPEGPAYPGEMSLRRLVDEGPRLADLRPSRRGVAVLRNGGVDRSSSAEVVAALIAGWPAVVMRLPAVKTDAFAPVVPILPVTPLTVGAGPAVYQRGPWAAPDELEGVVLPRPRAGTLRALLEGRRPGPSRWMRAWATVWRMPWA
jgi:hypothetical protein